MFVKQEENLWFYNKWFGFFVWLGAHFSFVLFLSHHLLLFHMDLPDKWASENYCHVDGISIRIKLSKISSKLNKEKGTDFLEWTHMNQTNHLRLKRKSLKPAWRHAGTGCDKRNKRLPALPRRSRLFYYYWINPFPLCNSLHSSIFQAPFFKPV